MPGTGRLRAWWVGQLATCPKCDEIVRLEAGDAQTLRVNASEVRWRCEGCGAVMSVKRKGSGR